jgi:CheY-like chemotaxis protein
MNNKGSILIVDDNMTLVTTITMILKRRGFQVESTYNGQDAISMIRKQPFSMILMDLKMPGMNGVEALKEIRAIRPDARVIIMTAYEMKDLLAEVEDMGVVSVLHKPFNMMQVLQIIDE